MHDENCFVTLTYSDEHLPEDYGLSKAEVQKFNKRLRKKLSPRKIRICYAGEYGDEGGRPHYHALIFNYAFLADRKPHTKNREGSILYTSEELSTLWGLGHCLIGELTFESAAYVARYCLKKVTGKNAEEAYSRVHPYTGEIHQVQPEFFEPSRRPGIGITWLNKYKSDVYPHDEVIVRGRSTRPPRAYDETLSETETEVIKKARMKKGRKHKKNNTPERRKVREQIKNAQVNELLKRKIRK